MLEGAALLEEVVRIHKELQQTSEGSQVLSLIEELNSKGLSSSKMNCRKMNSSKMNSRKMNIKKMKSEARSSGYVVGRRSSG
jgi:hypothetical protein